MRNKYRIFVDGCYVATVYVLRQPGDIIKLRREFSYLYVERVEGNILHCSWTKNPGQEWFEAHRHR